MYDLRFNGLAQLIVALSYDVSPRLKKLGDSLGLKIHVMHEDIFKSMHRI